MSRKTALIAISFLAVTAAHAAGESAVPFLTLGMGARAAAMAGAYTAVADGADALYWNPAGLCAIDRFSASVMHASYLEGTRYDTGAIAARVGKGAVAAGLQGFSAGSIDQTDTLGNKTGDFTPTDMAILVAYARPLGRTRAGVGVKRVRSRIIDTATAYAADAGVVSPPFARGRLRAALAVQNVGGGIKYETKTEDLPMQVRGGLAWRVRSALLASLDAVSPREGDAYFCLGSEYRLPVDERWRLAMRAGYTTETDDLSGFAGFTFGFGAGFRGIDLDYAFVPLGDLASTHRFSVAYRF